MRLGKRTAKLVREAAVLGFANGAYWAADRSWSECEANYPKDTRVVADVIRSARNNADLYPTLSKVEQVDDATAAALAEIDAVRMAVIRSLMTDSGSGVVSP
jgi:hypothetical protein